MKTEMFKERGKRIERRTKMKSYGKEKRKQKKKETEGRKENNGKWKNMEEKEERIQNRRQKYLRLPLLII
jgi:hypothetical protein